MTTNEERAVAKKKREGKRAHQSEQASGRELVRVRKRQRQGEQKSKKKKRQEEREIERHWKREMK